MSALHDYIAAKNDIEGLRDLLRRGENPNSQNRSGRTPLHIAVLKSERNPQDTDDILLLARELIRFGANVDQGNNKGKTPLHFAVSCRNCKLIEFFLQSNAEINKKDSQGYAALHLATTKARFRRHFLYDLELRVVKLLLEYDPDVDIQSRSNETPLMYAVGNNNLPIVSELLKKNASVNLKDSEGNYAMHYALSNIEVDVNVVFELRRHGCSFNLTNNSGKTPKNSYFSTLLKDPSCFEVAKAKHVIKLFMLDKYSFDNFENRCITEIDKNEKCQLSEFLDLSYNEIMKMHRDKLASNYGVYSVALRSFSCRAFENFCHIPLEVFDKVLEKLISRQYPVYCDVIVSGICRPYMNIKFAEMCCNTETGYKLLDFHVLYLVSFYLSNLDMLNMMIVCYREVRRSSIFSKFRSFYNEFDIASK